MDALIQSGVDSFQEKMVQRIRNDFPAKYAELEEPGVREYVGRCLRDAASFQLRVEGAIAQFISLRCQYGDRFELSPDRVWANRILEHEQLPDVAKISLIADRFEARVKGRILVRETARPLS